MCVSVSLLQHAAIGQSDPILEAVDRLQVNVIMRTNHIADQTHTLTFVLSNNDRIPILQGNRWKIFFSLREGRGLTQNEFTNDGLVIRATKGCFFEISAVAPTFSGLSPGQNASVTIERIGLAVFKFDVNNRFMITGPNLTPQPITSTKDPSLGFVTLSRDNDTFYDFSRMNAFRRSMLATEMRDMGSLGRDLVVPGPKNLTAVERPATPGTPPGPVLIDLFENQVYLWMDQSISDRLKSHIESKHKTAVH